MKEETLQKFAELVERDEAVVRAEISAIMDEESVSEDTAFGMWKSQNSMSLRSGKAQEITVRILSRETPKIRNISTGESKVAGIEVIYKDEEGQVGWGYSALWGDKADIATQIAVGEAYKAKARFAYQPTKVKMTDFSILGDANDTEVPTVQEVAAKWELGTLDRIEDFAGNTELFAGMVSKLIQSTDGVDAVIGFEMSTDDSMPITVWGGRGRDNPPVPEVQAVLNALNRGDNVLTYAYVFQKDDGSVSLNAGGVFGA